MVPSDSGTEIHCFHGSGSEHGHEYKQLREIYEALLHPVVQPALSSEIFHSPIFFLSNVYMGYDIDLILLTGRGIVLVELKDMKGRITGSENGDWEIIPDEGPRIPARSNLFRKAKEVRSRFAEVLLDFNLPMFTDKHKGNMNLQSWLYFPVGSEDATTIWTRQDRIWFDIVTAETIAEHLQEVNARYTLNERQMLEIVDALHLTPFTFEKRLLNEPTGEPLAASEPVDPVPVEDPPACADYSVAPPAPEPPAAPSPSPSPAYRPMAVTGKYSPLHAHLSRSTQLEERLSFDEVERILGAPLPPSARKYQMWWANGGHTQADAWLNAGFRVETVRLGSSVVFRRATAAPTLAPGPHLAASPEPPRFPVTGKYAPLAKHLSRVSGSKCTMTFAEIEALLGQPLPPSAYRHAFWWRDGYHPHTAAWNDAGWRIDRVVLGDRVQFRRGGDDVIEI